jgi:hypothetical protein
MIISSLSILGFLLFVIHELEEILRFRPWIVKHQNDPAYKNDNIIKRSWAYPSTTTIIIMIIEECILFLIMFAFAVILESYELALAAIIINVLHLFVHCVDAVRSSRWTPGSMTALPTAIIAILLVWVVMATQYIQLGQLLLLVAVLGVFMLINLLLLQKNAQRIERWQKKVRLHAR